MMARRRHVGFALAAVLGILTILSLLIAAAMGRALANHRLALAAEQQLQLEVVLLEARTAVLTAVVDSARVGAAPPFAPLDSGTVPGLLATARWRIEGNGRGWGVATITATAEAPGTRAATGWTLWLRPVRGEDGAWHWRVAGPGLAGPRPIAEAPGRVTSVASRS